MNTLHDPASSANIIGGRLLDLAKFSDPPPPTEWAVQDMIPKGLTTLAYGTGGVGKSFWFLTLAMHMACGRDFGKVRSHEYLRTCFFSREDPEQVIHRRVHQIKADMGLSPTEWDMIQSNVMFWELSGARDVALDDNSGFPEAAAEFCALEEVGMAVMDNLSMMLPVSTEEQKHSINAQETAAMVHSVCSQITQRAGGCAVVLMHHPNKSDSISGSQLLSDNARSVLSFKYPVIKATPAQRRNGEDDVVDYQEFVLRVEKNNLGPTDRMGTRWRKGPEGVPFPSLFAA